MVRCARAKRKARAAFIRVRTCAKNMQGGALLGARCSSVAQVRANGIDDAGESVAFEACEQILLDARDEAGTAIGQRAVKLHQRRTAADFRIGVRARLDAADADQGELRADTLA